MPNQIELSDAQITDLLEVLAHNGRYKQSCTGFVGGLILELHDEYDPDHEPWIGYDDMIAEIRGK